MWYFPDEEIAHVPTAQLLLTKSDVDRLRKGLAARIGASRVEAARSAVLKERASVVASPKSSPKRGSWADKKFSEVVNAYCKDPHGLSRTLSDESEIAMRKRGLLLFSEFMGDPSLGQIDRDMLSQFIYEILPRLPNKPNNLPGAISCIKDSKGISRKLSMKRIVEVLDKLDWMVNGAVWPKMTDSARDERRQWLCGLFRWALEEGYSDVNPAASFEGRKAVAKRKKGELSRQERQSFSDEQLRKIFSKERFVTGGRESTHKNGIIYPFEYWLPLLALYAGLRIEEAAQLHLDDIACRDGIWILKINSNGEKSLKNDNAAREIPIHPELIRLGLLRYRDRLCDEGYLRLFPELTYDLNP
jgi:integrase